MDVIILVLAILLWIFTWKFGWRIMKWKNRKMALVMTVLIPYIGLLFALFLDQKCPHCGKYINMAADVCRYCAKDIKTGKPRARIGHAASDLVCDGMHSNSEYYTAKVICENCGFIKDAQVRKVKWWDAAWFGIPVTLLILLAASLFYFLSDIKLRITTVLMTIALGLRAVNPDNYPSARVSCPSCHRAMTMVPCDSWAGRRALKKLGRK